MLLFVPSFFIRPCRWHEPQSQALPARHLALSIVAVGLAALIGPPVAAQSPGLTPTIAAHTTGSGGSDTLTVFDSLLPPPFRAVLLRTNPEVSARRATLAAVRARRDATGFAPPAVLSSGLEDAPRGRFGPSTVRLEVQQEFLSGGRRSAARATADAEVQAATAALRIAELRVTMIAVRVTAQTIGWRTVAGRLAMQDSLLASAEASLRTRFTVGDARYVDMLRIRTERLRVQTERAAAVADAETGRIVLEGVLGGTDGDTAVWMHWIDQLADSLVMSTGGNGPRHAFMAGGFPSAPTVDSLLARAGLIQLADAEVTRAIAAQQAIRANQRPQWSAGIGIQRIGSTDGLGASLGPVVGMTVSLPFTAGRANRAAVAAAERDVAAATAARTATRVDLRSALRAARVRYDAARMRLATYDAALLRGARDERESALTAYQNGTLSLLELVDFERALSNAEIARMRATIDAASALADLFTGGAVVTDSRDADTSARFQVTP